MIGPATLRRIAASVDAPMSLLPVFDELFAGVESLGSSPRAVVAAMRRAGIGRDSSVLDLACGKGAAAIALAKSLGCRVTGVDACDAFIRSARTAAAKATVETDCRFVVGDVDDYRTSRAGKHDAAIMLGLYAAPRAARLLRRHVRRGGVYLIDDAFRVEDASLSSRLGPFYTDVPTIEQIRRQLARTGDILLRETIPSMNSIATTNARLYKHLSRSAAMLRRSHPELAAALREFLRNQRDANRLLIGPLRPAMWLMRRE